jgi:hypothetical protein
MIQPIAQLHQIDLLVMLAVPIVAMRVQLVAAVDEFLNRVVADHSSPPRSTLYRHALKKEPIPPAVKPALIFRSLSSLSVGMKRRHEMIVE